MFALCFQVISWLKINIEEFELVPIGDNVRGNDYARIFRMLCGFLPHHLFGSPFGGQKQRQGYLGLNYWEEG